MAASNPFVVESQEDLQHTYHGDVVIKCVLDLPDFDLMVDGVVLFERDARLRSIAATHGLRSGHYCERLDIAEYTEVAGNRIYTETIRRVVEAAGPRLKALGDIVDYMYFFEPDDAFEYDEEAFDKYIRGR